MGMWLTCGGQGDTLQTHGLFHTHFLCSEVTTPPRSSSRKTFHILNACNDFLEYGLTGLRNELWECHPRCAQAQVTTCDLRIHIEPQELQNKQYNRLLFFFFLFFASPLWLPISCVPSPWACTDACRKCGNHAPSATWLSSVMWTFTSVHGQ